jgi:hypothetical protein
MLRSDRAFLDEPDEQTIISRLARLRTSDAAHACEWRARSVFLARFGLTVHSTTVF